VSVVLQNFETNFETELPYIFGLFVPETLRFLTIARTRLSIVTQPAAGYRSVRWCELVRFSRLEVLKISDQSQLPVLDSQFGSFSLQRLHTLQIEFAGLRLIGPHAFWWHRLTLRRL